MQPRGLVVSFMQAALFTSGTDAISPDALEGLGKVAVGHPQDSQPRPAGRAHRFDAHSHVPLP